MSAISIVNRREAQRERVKCLYLVDGDRIAKELVLGFRW